MHASTSQHETGAQRQHACVFATLDSLFGSSYSLKRTIAAHIERPMLAVSALGLLGRLGVPRVAASAYAARGAWLAVSFAGALALFFGAFTLTHAVWPTVSASLPGGWLADTYVLSTAVNGGAQVLCNLLLLPLYVSGAADRWKSEPGKPWPWAATPEAAAKFWATLRRGAGLVTFNILVVAGVGLVTIAPIVRALGLETSYAATDLPSAATTASHMLFCLIVEDAMFYTSHRLMHTPFLYRTIHKLHHEYESVIGAASEHAHPVEFVLGNLAPVIMGPLLCRAHGSTLLLFLALRIAVSVEEHSGLSVPFSPLRVSPWGAMAAGHAWHHSHVVGVFASQFSWWDTLLGTDKAFLEWLADEEAQKRKAKAH